MAAGGVGTPEKIAGLQNIAGQTIDGQPIPGNGVANHLQILAQQKSAKEEVKQLGDALGKLMNEVKGFAQRQQEQQQQQPNNGLAPEDAADIKAQLIKAEVKAETSKAAHDQKLQQRRESHELEMANKLRASQVEETATDLETAAKIRREAAKPEPVST